MASAESQSLAAPPTPGILKEDALSVPVSSLSSLAAIEQQLHQLSYQESSLDASLATLINSRHKLLVQLKTLQGLNEVVDGIQREAEFMAGQVGDVATTAERVGGKVRVLDEEQSRVKESIEVVQAVQDLKSSIASLDIAMQREDWESATRFMQRATAIDPEIIASGFAEAVVPTSELPQTPPQTLATLKASLLETFLTSFRAASSTGDTNNINRFFKLFPMIGEDDVGLGVYAEWVGGIVRTKAGTLVGKSQTPTHFSSLLTNLFESIALIISQHQPVVEKYYGPSKMTTVAASLIDECDRLGLKVMLNWEEERQIKKKLVETKEYGWNKKLVVTLNHAGGAGDEDKADPREIDALLNEVATMNGRWQLLRRFLYNRLKDPDEDEESAPTTAVPTTKPSMYDDPPPTAATVVPPTPAPPTKEEKLKQLDEEADLTLVEESRLGTKLKEKLKEVYTPMEVWYLRSSVEKAHQMDELDLLSLPSLSSSLDDTFYILKKTIYRLLSTCSIDTFVATAKDIKLIMDKDVADVWRHRMENAFKDVAGPNGGSGGGVGGGRGREDEKDRREKEAKGIFVTYLNNLDTAAEYTVRMIDEMVAGEALSQSFFLEGELERARIAILGVRSTEDKFRGVLKSGLDHLFNQLLRPKLRPILSDVYKDVSYLLNEDQYAEAEYRDDVRKRFIKAWETLLAGYKEAFTPPNFNLFFATAVNVLVRPWEGIIRGMKFTELGALRLDRDLRSILSYLSSQSSFATASLRESFSRLQQIATLLTLDSPEEAEEVLSTTGNRLTQTEVKVIWAMRVK